MRKIFLWSSILLLISINMLCSSTVSEDSNFPESAQIIIDTNLIVDNPAIKDIIYKNLVFKGGGVKGPAYVGCMEVLEANGKLAAVENVAGTSVGSITAALLAVGFNSAELRQAFVETNFSSIVEDKGGVIGEGARLEKSFGLHTGHEFIAQLKERINQGTGNPNITFKELDALVAKHSTKYKHLFIIASNISTGNADVFSAATTPDVPIWKAVRCSMSIPILFEPFLLEENFYVDGGIGWNYPIDLFDEENEHGKKIINNESLGFFLQNPNKADDKVFFKSKVEINSIRSSAAAIVKFMMNSMNDSHISDGDKARTVFVNDLNVDPTNFDISTERIEELMASGQNCMIDFLKEQ